MDRITLSTKQTNAILGLEYKANIEPSRIYLRQLTNKRATGRVFKITDKFHLGFNKINIEAKMNGHFCKTHLLFVGELPEEVGLSEG